MGDLVLKLFNMSINAGFVILAVLIIRTLTQKAPKFINVLLWLAVVLRLTIPFSLESVLSVIPSKEVITTTAAPTVSQNVTSAVTEALPQVDIGVPVINETVNEYISESVINTPNAEKTFIDIMLILGIIWAVGVAVCLMYTTVSYLRLKRNVRISLLKQDNIYYCDNIALPFILGIIRPKIYLPSDIAEEDEVYVLLHEKAHLKRKDYLWKPIGFILLSVYWFNPLVWVAYIMFCRDVELACDEKAVKGMTKKEKIEYSKSLVNCSINQKLVTVNPLTFGGISVKSRIKNILNYKKPSVWVILVVVLLSCFLLVGFMTDPVDKTDKKDNKEKVETVVSNDDTKDTSSEPTSSEEDKTTESEPEESVVNNPNESGSVESKPLGSNSTKNDLENTNSETNKKEPLNSYLDNLSQPNCELKSNAYNPNIPIKTEIIQKIKDDYAKKRKIEIEKINLHYRTTLSNSAIFISIECIDDMYLTWENNRLLFLGEYIYAEKYPYLLKIYKDGEFYSIEEAYKNGIITDDILSEIFVKTK